MTLVAMLPMGGWLLPIMGASFRSAPNAAARGAVPA